MEKYFNIAGACVPGEHYIIPALERLPEVARLIDRNQSFAIHAARQSGKTTALMALVRVINDKVEKRAVYFTLEAAQPFRDPESYAQLTGYLDTIGQTEGWMAVFDTKSEKPWDEKLFIRDETSDGKTIHVVGL